MFRKQELDNSFQIESQKSTYVPISPKPIFINQIASKNRQRIRSQARKKSHKRRVSQMKNQFNLTYNEATFKMTQSQEELEIKTTYVQGNKIQGSWKNGQLHGNVKIQYQTGQYFEGKYQNGVRVQGFVRFNDKTQYKGGFLKDIFHGMGSLKDPSGRVITCQWQNGEPVGNGKIQYVNGDIYFGQILNLKKHGQGHLFFKNGCKYVGSFCNGTISGQGSYYQNNIVVASGIWENGALQIQEGVKQIITGTLINMKNSLFNVQIQPKKKKVKLAEGPPIQY